MILEFLDKSQINVKTIFGTPRWVMGIMRDTLHIEVDSKTISFEELKNHFKDNPKTATLYTYNEKDEKITLGEGYTVFVSISDERKKIESPPGKLVPNEYEDVYIVTIAQLTWQEYTYNLTPPKPLNE